MNDCGGKLFMYLSGKRFKKTMADRKMRGSSLCDPWRDKNNYTKNFELLYIKETHIYF